MFLLVKETPKFYSSTCMFSVPNTISILIVKDIFSKVSMITCVMEVKRNIRKDKQDHMEMLAEQVEGAQT